ncbi:hypothetical protein L208DRAFT_1320518 [Tricholoma matsutake]|nr:hypothetical protein L208DRAFT_1320518 [Tricholoma matsutake 945]
MSDAQFSKHQCIDKGSHHNWVDLSDDFKVVHTREVRVVKNGRLPHETPCSPQKGHTTWTTCVSWAPEDNPEFALNPDGNWYDVELNAPITDTTAFQDAPSAGKIKKKKTMCSKRPHAFWKENYHSLYLDEMLRWEGRGDLHRETKCCDCMGWKVQALCCIRLHKMHPFHVIEMWNRSYFNKVSLKSLGLRIQLQHVSMHCSNPIASHEKFQVLHTNGIHDVAVNFCGCERALPHHIQVLHCKLYPSSQAIVKTCTMPLKSLRTTTVLCPPHGIALYCIWFYNGDTSRC